MASIHRNNIFNNSSVFIVVFVIIDFLVLTIWSFELSTDLDRFNLPERFNNKPVSNEFTKLKNTYNPVDLGNGAPNWLPPLFMRNALTNVTMSSNAMDYQYSPAEGIIELRTEIASLYSTLINRTLDPSNNVIVTLGALEALYLSVLAHTLPGDEWILIEPAFEYYFAIIKMNGGTVRPIRLNMKSTEGKLSSGDLVLDKDEVRKAFNSRTKGIIVNSPHNPTGKSFTKDELLFIAELAIKWNTLIVCDDVYEFLVYDLNKHIRMATLGDEIYRRLITISSISKSYSATGWRVGWAYGPTQLISNLKAEHNFIVFSMNTYTQKAAAEGLRQISFKFGRSYFKGLVKLLESKRNFMIEILDRIGVDAIVPQSGYYIFMNWTSLESRSNGFENEDGNTTDVKFIKWLIKNAGIAANPGIASYTDADKDFGKDFIRICFAKVTETLQEAATLLLKRFG